MASDAPITPAVTPPLLVEGEERPFRVIVAGCGVSGLAVAHALGKAGVDHVILEKGVVAPDWGASISLWGHGSRLLAQLGVLEALEARALPLKVLHTREINGKAFSEEAFFDMMLERNGFEAITMERREFLEIVYAQLKDKSKILTGKRICQVSEDEDSVVVSCTDGSRYTGDVLIGADGVHSTIREQMWNAANARIPNAISADEKRTLVTTYNSLIGVAKTIPGLGIRDMHWVSARGLSFLLLTQPDKTFFFVNWKLPQPLKWPTKAKWSAEEVDRAAASVAEIRISDTLTFGELWKGKYRAHLIGLEEGIFEHWSFGRIALCGDSVHKVTPNFALGANCAMESTAVLLNKLVQLQQSGQRPSRTRIAAALRAYEEERKPRMRLAFDASALITRLQAYDGWFNWFAMRHVFPRQGQASYADVLADLCCGAPRFDFLPIVYGKPATFKWKDDASHVPAAIQSARQLRMRMMDVALTEVVFLLGILLFGFTIAPAASISATTTVMGPGGPVASWSPVASWLEMN